MQEFLWFLPQIPTPVVDTAPTIVTTLTIDSAPPLPHSSGRVVYQPKRFMFLGESSNLIPGDEHDNDPWTYNEAMNDIDVDKWCVSMKWNIIP